MKSFVPSAPMFPV